MYTVTTLHVSNVTKNNYVIKFVNINYGTKIFWSRNFIAFHKTDRIQKLLAIKTHVLHDLMFFRLVCQLL